MLLTIGTTHRPATDLGYLLHKHPDRFQSFDLSFGQAHVYYPQATEESTIAAMLLDVDPVGIVRGKSREQSFRLDNYVNDRPYVASSYLSVAIAQVFRSALAGVCQTRQNLAQTAIPLVARIDVLPARDGEPFIRRMFEPLGYSVTATGCPLDDRFAEWGDSPYFSVTLAGMKTLAELLSHLYVLVPVFDDRKHYFVGPEELEKLLDKGRSWMASHPEKSLIARRYLRHKGSLYREAIARLTEDEPAATSEETTSEEASDLPEEVVAEKPEKSPSLNEQRLAAVLAALVGCGAKSVIDLGCGEGNLLRKLLAENQFERIVGLDVAMRSLEIAKRRLRLERLPERVAKRIELMHGSLLYRDKRMANFDAAAIVEVIEHLDPPRLAALERVVFEFARPQTIVVTTPNREYNVQWETLPAGEFRHGDHRFEWSRSEFQSWAERVAERNGYRVRLESVGPVDAQVGSPTQMAIFTWFQDRTTR